MASVRVEPVQTKREQRAFINFLWDLYKGDPNWVPPLIMTQKENLNYRKQPFYDRNTIQTFLAYQNDRVVGRIAAIVNVGHNERYKEKRGFFGFFESIDSVDVASALFDAASNHLRQQGMEHVRGPVNPSLNHDIGCLVEGFDTPPTFMMTYNPKYYDRLITEYGFEKTQDAYAFEAEATLLDRIDPKLRFVIDEVKRRFNVSVRPIDRKKFGEEVRLFLHIYNRSLEGTWGFVPMSDAEVDFMAKGLKMLLAPELTSIIEVDGKPVGAGLGLLDFNPRIKAINGRLFPFGFTKLLFGTRSIDRVRLVSTNVLPEWQRWGLGLVALEGMLPKCLERGIKYAEFSWVLESNDLSRGSLERSGVEKTKTYRIYDKALS
jgi:GNAT superfamily N-acetyltransferase